MAEADWPNADRRDEDKIYNPMTFAELKTLAPQISVGRAVQPQPACR